MRILLTVDPEIPVPPKLYGGIERIVDGLATELRLLGHAVGLAAHPDSSCSVDAFFPWPAAASAGVRNSSRNTQGLMRAVQSFQPDAIHSFSRLAYLLPLLTRRTAKVMSYQRHTGGRRIAIASRLGGRSLAFTACSEFISKMGGKAGGYWTVIPNFIDVGFYRFVPAIELAPDAPLVFLSRVEEIKGAHNAIAIAQQAQRRLLIAGNKVANAQGDAYWRDRIEPHLGKNGIEYVGPVNDDQKNALLGSAAAMVVPIEWDEPFGIVFAEALACGTPVISCPRGALPEIVEHGRHGYLVRSIAEGVEAVGKLPEIDRAACRKRAEDQFSRSVVTRQYEALYSRMVEGVRR